LGKVPFEPLNMIHWWHDKTTQMSEMQFHTKLCNTQAQEALPAMQIRMESRSFAPSFGGIGMDFSADDVF
jgi:hypothetical protein